MNERLNPFHVLKFVYDCFFTQSRLTSLSTFILLLNFNNRNLLTVLLVFFDKSKQSKSRANRPDTHE